MAFSLLGEQCTRNFALIGPVLQLCVDVSPCLQQLLQINVALHAWQALQHIHHVLSRDVAAGALCVGTAA